MGKPVTHAMILAAGFGLRLKPLTDAAPKALVPYNNKPMIENVIIKLVDAGIINITVNTHYFAKQIQNFIESNNFGVQINLTFEENILGTGGGIKNSKEYLAGSGNFIIHNVDVVSDMDIGELALFHRNNDALATIAVKKRDTGRPLLMDKDNNLIGRAAEADEQLTGQKHLHKTAFCGIYILSDRVFDLFPQEEKFDIISFLLDAVKKNERVLCHDIGNSFWKDLGRLEDLNS